MAVILSRGILVRWHLQFDQYQKKVDTVFVIRRAVLLVLMWLLKSLVIYSAVPL